LREIQEDNEGEFKVAHYSEKRGIDLSRNSVTELKEMLWQRKKLSSVRS
jgi:hypothetical protein